MDKAKSKRTSRKSNREMESLGNLVSVASIKLGYKNHLKYSLAKDEYSATAHDRYYALALTIRDRLIERWIQTSQSYHTNKAKRVYYLSMEYLIGRAMGNNVINLGLEDAVTEAMKELDLDWHELRDLERDAGLGNGGLGRLAACFLDSLATLELPGYGYGVRYDYGIFRQIIKDGFQVEEPDNWLRHGDPWEIERPESQFEVSFGGEVIEEQNHSGKYVPRWVNFDTVIGIPYDFPVAGYNNNTVNNLRLWTAKATEEFHLEFFNNGDYVRAYENKMLSENITKVLYPSDNIEKGKKLRFKQQYFFVSCSLQDIIRRHKEDNDSLNNFAEKNAIHLNDTHPAIAIPELMRIFIDEENMHWDKAWPIVKKTFAYTNHTLLPEALEKWPVRMFEELLPRHLHIIYEINRRFLRSVMNRFPYDTDRLRRMSLIEESDEKQVRMGYLSIVGSHKVNGVAELHSELLKETLFRDFCELEPNKFINVTNGITPRRWLLKCNPGLSELITENIGPEWAMDLSQLKKLEKFVDDKKFKKRLQEIKYQNKLRLVEVIKKERGIEVDPNSIFDVQVKRLHEYKRQLLNVMHILGRYCKLKDNPNLKLQPRTFIFAAKAAPGYAMAKRIIKLINDVAGIINVDPEVNDKIKVVFLSDYRVSLAERIIPASDLSEQISTAGKEASGTGNMKFALNGALTIGTLDGANVEIREEVGADNFFLFGHTVDELKELKESGYNPWDFYNKYPELKRLLDLFSANFFNLEQPGLYQMIWDALLTHGDTYFHLADYHSYIECQNRVDEAYADQDRWARMCIMNIANMGKFSTDRTIAEYAENVWGVKPCHIDLVKHPENHQHK